FFQREWQDLCDRGWAEVQDSGYQRIGGRVHGDSSGHWKCIFAAFADAFVPGGGEIEAVKGLLAVTEAGIIAASHFWNKGRSTFVQVTVGSKQHICLAVIVSFFVNLTGI